MIRVVQFIAALAEFVADGCETVSAAEYRRRLEICDRCPDRSGPQCSLCGCVLTIKAVGRAWDCPHPGGSRWVPRVAGRCEA